MTMATVMTTSLSISRHNKHWPVNLTVLLSVFFLRPKKGHTVRQMWRGPVHGALFCRISYQSKFVNHPNCEYCVSW